MQLELTIKYRRLASYLILIQNLKQTKDSIHI